MKTFTFHSTTRNNVTEFLPLHNMDSPLFLQFTASIHSHPYKRPEAFINGFFKALQNFTNTAQIPVPKPLLHFKFLSWQHPTYWHQNLYSFSIIV